MKTKTLLCVCLLCTLSCALYAQGKKLSINDAVRISNMKNMDEAADLLKANGYSEAKQEDRFYSSKTVTYWYQDCELYCGGINCFNTVDVKKKSASSVSILANGIDDVVNIYVYNEKTKNDYVKQMKRLGFKRIQWEQYNGDTGEYYANATDTIEIRRNEDAPKYYFFDNHGQSDTINLENKHFDSFFSELKPQLEKAGYQLSKKDGKGFEFKRGADYVKLVKADDVWDGNVFEFSVCRKRDWSDDGDGEEFYGPNGEHGPFTRNHLEEEQPLQIDPLEDE